MTDELPDVLRDVLGHVVAEQRREWRREREVIQAQSREVVADLRAQIAELTERVRQSAAAAVNERLAALRDGRDGEPGAPGEPGVPGECGPPGEIPMAPEHVAEDISRVVSLLSQTAPAARHIEPFVLNINTGAERTRKKTITMRKDGNGNSVADVVETE